MEIEQELFRTDDIAKLVGVNPMTIRRWTQKGIIPGMKIEKTWFYNKEEVIKALDKMKVLVDNIY